MSDRQAFAALLKRKSAPAAEKGFGYTKGQQLTADQVNELLSNKLKWSDYGLQDYNTYGSVDDYAKELNGFQAADEFGWSAQGTKLPGNTFRAVVPDGKGGVKQYTIQANGYDQNGATYSQDKDGNTITTPKDRFDPSKGFTITEGGDGGWEWKNKQDWYNAEAEEQAPSGFDSFMEAVIPTVVGSMLGGPLLGPTLGTTLGTAVGASAANTFAHGGNLADFAKNTALAYAGGQVANYINPSLATSVGPIQPNAIQSTLGNTGAKLVSGAASGLVSSGGDPRGLLSGAVGTGINMAIPGDGIGYDIARTAARTGVGLLTAGNSGAVGAATNTTGTDTPPAATGWGSTNSRREFADKLIKG